MDIPEQEELHSISPTACGKNVFSIVFSQANPSTVPDRLAEGDMELDHFPVGQRDFQQLVCLEQQLLNHLCAGLS